MMEVAAFDGLKVGRLLWQARGSMTVTEAANRAGVSRGWWEHAERGFANHKPKPEKLAAACAAVSANLGDVFRAAGYNPAPFRSTAATDGSARSTMDVILEEMVRMSAALERQGHEREQQGKLLEQQALALEQQGKLLAEFAQLLVALGRPGGGSGPGGPPADAPADPSRNHS